MGTATKYVSKKPDENGFIHWSEEENRVWHDLVTRQLSVIEGRACEEYINGLRLLDLPRDRVPQLEEINCVLRKTTGWECVEVPALIDFDRFFSLLAAKRFPVATFLRRREEFDYLQEPDFFHEVFGHCAMLTNPAFAEFTHTYGRLGYEASKEDRVYLARLYWFTVEFGLLRHNGDIRIYGGGILSSPGETEYAVTSDKPEYREFDTVDIMRTPYRIDIMQPIYFVIDDIGQLYELARQDIMGMVQQAKSLGLHAPVFPPKNNKETTGDYV
ncbi:phenylalanine 4-monooxygenase [Photobacterium sp. J15]|uniref:phenylalanine 4-monooxygenase n=1 Tax=Photobacterium sp. J15 TaxID=265901 RepID=UPI0007E3215C|nr:phenylalanine 4-monooxygenase [Photobacterium sp. J15]